MEIKNPIEVKRKHQRNENPMNTKADTMKVQTAEKLASSLRKMKRQSD